MEISKDILDACRRGDHLGQERLYRHVYCDLMRISLRYVFNESDAQDVINRAMFKVFTKISDFSGNHLNFGGWIRRIVIHESIDFIRSAKVLSDKVVSSEIREDMTPGYEPDDPGPLVALLELLPAMASTVFNLYAIEGYSHKEIASLLGITRANSKWQLHVARKQLRELVEKKDLI